MGLTQPEVASAVGITQSHLSRIERGSDTKISTLQAIARVLRCHPAELWGGFPSEDSPADLLVSRLAAALRVRFAFISEIADAASRRIRLLSIWHGSEHGETFEYSVDGTPCEHVVGQGAAKEVVFYPDGLQERFPNDVWLRGMGIESYLAVSLADTEGNPLGHMGVMHDEPMQASFRSESIVRLFAATGAAVVERKRAVSALYEAEGSYRDLVENAQMAVYRQQFSQPMRIFLGPHIEELTGYPLDDFLFDRSFWGGLIHPEDRTRVYSELEQAIENSTVFQSQYRVRHRAGGERFVLDIARPFDPGTMVARWFHGIVIDVTEQGNREENPHGALKLEALRRLADGVAHGFDNLLTAVLGIS